MCPKWENHVITETTESVFIGGDMTKIMGGTEPPDDTFSEGACTS